MPTSHRVVERTSKPQGGGILPQLHEIYFTTVEKTILCGLGVVDASSIFGLVRRVRTLDLTLGNLSGDNDFQI
jgi:hypothetical protein